MPHGQVQGCAHTGRWWLAQPPLKLVLHHHLSIKSATQIILGTSLQVYTHSRKVPLYFTYMYIVYLALGDCVRKDCQRSAG